MERTLGKVTVQCLGGDIAAQSDIKAVVNAANAALRSGGGVAGALHRAAGSGLEEECRLLAPIKPGQAVITGGYNLPNAYVIHCLGPVYGVDRPEDELLAGCYRNALLLADEKSIDSIAFPSLSTGAFGYPLEEAAEIAMSTVKETIPGLRSVRLIRFVLYGDQALRIHQKVLAKYFK